MRYLIAILMALALCGCKKAEEPKVETTREEASIFHDGCAEDCPECRKLLKQDDGFKIQGEDYTPPTETEYGYDIEIRAVGDKFEVTYSGREIWGYYCPRVFKVSRLGDIRPTPEAMRAAGCEETYETYITNF